MAPLIFALALLAQDAPATEAPSPDASPDGPVATAVPRKQTVAPLPIQGGPVTPPSDDYGYVGWCYGAMSGYVELYDRAMPEVTRIERAWPTPSTEENIREVYPAQRDEAKRNLVLFARAMEAAEKASPTPIQDQGAAAIRRGRGVWTGAGNVPKAQLAQFWMSWSPPAKCEETARTLEARSNLFGQALSFNAPGAAPVAPPPPGDPAAPALMATTTDEPAATPADVPATTATELEPAAETAPEAPAEVAPAAEQVTITSTEGPTESSDTPMVAVDRLPSGDPESDADLETVDESPLDGAGEPLAAPESASEIADDPEAAVPVNSGASPTAIDDLLPTEGAPAEAVAAEPEPEPVAAEPAPPAPPEQPATPKRKRGLKDTLMGLKGPQ
ncbi:MAG: hypothetical protein Q8L23_16305 [Caulobacter sp.]|nr:hypothetical protein [Caulobacter sp.]